MGGLRPIPALRVPGVFLEAEEAEEDRDVDFLVDEGEDDHEAGGEERDADRPELAVPGREPAEEHACDLTAVEREDGEQVHQPPPDVNEEQIEEEQSQVAILRP